MIVECLPRFQLWSPWKQLSILLGSLLAFLIAFAILYPVIGGIAIILSFVPVAAVSWLMGRRAGMLSGAAAVLVNILLLTLAGERGWEIIFGRGGVSSLTLILLGWLAGWASQLVERMRSHTIQLEQDREELRSEIVMRKLTELKLETALAEREILLKEIHHRVKNNLQIISSLLHLQASATDDPTIQMQYQDSQNRIRSMALVHERLYRSDDLIYIDFELYLHDLTDHLLRSYGIPGKGIRLKIEANDIQLNIDTAITCGLLVNELVSNALKHAFPDGRDGEIAIEMRCGVDGQYRLMVCDDGRGMPAGLDWHNTTSLGMQLVNSLTRQLGGTVEMTTTPGTLFAIQFPAETLGKE